MVMVPPLAAAWRRTADVTASSWRTPAQSAVTFRILMLRKLVLLLTLLLMLLLFMMMLMLILMM